MRVFNKLLEIKIFWNYLISNWIPHSYWSKDILTGKICNIVGITLLHFPRTFPLSLFIADEKPHCRSTYSQFQSNVWAHNYLLVCIMRLRLRSPQSAVELLCSALWTQFYRSYRLNALPLVHCAQKVLFSCADVINDMRTVAPRADTMCSYWANEYSVKRWNERRPDKYLASIGRDNGSGSVQRTAFTDSSFAFHSIRLPFHAILVDENGTKANDLFISLAPTCCRARASPLRRYLHFAGGFEHSTWHQFAFVSGFYHFSLNFVIY